MRRALPALWAASLYWCVAAQPGSTVNALVEMVRSGLRGNESDRSVARSVGRLKLAERLDNYVIEGLESEGAGPRVLAELLRLQEASAALPDPAAAPVFRHDASPSPGEQVRLIDEVRDTALNYDRSLPDFLCTQSVRRYINPRGRWDLRDTLVLRLTYFEGREQYRVTTVNGRFAVSSYTELGGAVSTGEFGSLLHSIFRHETAAVLRWDHWTTLRKRQAHVFRFDIDAARSMYRIDYRSAGTPLATAVVGQHGYVYLDRDTRSILRIDAVADSIPREFPVRTSSTLLDYDFTEIAGRRYLLPLRATIRMGTDFVQTRNEVEFRAYRKFAADTSVTFEPK